MNQEINKRIKELELKLQQIEDIERQIFELKILKTMIPYKQFPTMPICCRCKYIPQHPIKAYDYYLQLLEEYKNI